MCVRVGVSVCLCVYMYVYVYASMSVPVSVSVCVPVFEYGIIACVQCSCCAHQAVSSVTFVPEGLVCEH